MAWPLCATRYLPIEDLPQHIAAIRVLHSFHDPAFGFQRYFEIDLFRTQYLAYYLLADALAYVVDLELGNRLIVIACVMATPYALRYLLRSLQRPELFALFALPLTYNAHLILGFINFLMAIPAALFGLGLCVKQRVAETRGRALLLALVAVFCFFSHVVPFAFLALGALLLALGRSPREVLRRLLPLVPAGLCALLWLARSPAGRATLTAAHGGGEGPAPQYQPAVLAWRDLPNWLTDVLYGPEGLRELRWYAWVLGIAFFAGCVCFAYRWLRARTSSQPSAAGSHVLTTPTSGVSMQASVEASDAAAADAARASTDARARAAALESASPRATSAPLPPSAAALCWRLAALAPLAVLLYFVMPVGYDWIWPIAQRFPLLALLLAIPILPRPPLPVNVVLALALLALSWSQLARTARAFAAFDQEEVGELDRALAAIPPAKRVMGLIFSRGSRYVKFSPFIHSVAYYQARKGGAVMFTFADFPQSPFRFRDNDRPPRVKPRWEWLPQLVRAGDIGWYDYLLVRAGSPPCAAGRCELRLRAGMWSVWQLSPAH